MAVPGLKKSDFQVDIDNQVLSISTETKEENEHKDGNYTRREFGYSSFKRTFSLPESVNDDKIDASYKDGILSFNLAKKEEAKMIVWGEIMSAVAGKLIYPTRLYTPT